MSEVEDPQDVCHTYSEGSHWRMRREGGVRDRRDIECVGDIHCVGHSLGNCHRKRKVQVLVWSLILGPIFKMKCSSTMGREWLTL